MSVNQTGSGAKIVRARLQHRIAHSTCGGKGTDVSTTIKAVRRPRSTDGSARSGDECPQLLHDHFHKKDDIELCRQVNAHENNYNPHFSVDDQESLFYRGKYLAT
jgi:hypothetical protein